MDEQPDRPYWQRGNSELTVIQKNAPVSFRPGDGVIVSRLNHLIEINNFSNEDLAKDPEINIREETVSKHRNGRSPISWEMAEAYAKFFKDRDIMVDPIFLITTKVEGSMLFDSAVDAGRIEVIGQFVQSNGSVEVFERTDAPLFLKSDVLNHYIINNADNYGLTSFIFVDGEITSPFRGLEDFHMQDYHYWITLKSPMINKIVHKFSNQNLCVVKLKDKDIHLAGMVYQNPKRNSQAPTTYSISDPGWGMKNQFTPQDMDLSSVELEWSTPVVNAIMNPQANGIDMVQEKR